MTKKIVITIEVKEERGAGADEFLKAIPAIALTALADAVSGGRVPSSKDFLQSLEELAGLSRQFLSKLEKLDGEDLRSLLGALQGLSSLLRGALPSSPCRDLQSRGCSARKGLQGKWQGQSTSPSFGSCPFENHNKEES